MKFLLRLMIALGTVLLVAGVVAWKAPSDWFVKRAADPRYDIRYSGTSGTMWDGKALDVRWHERSLGDVEWNFMTLDQFYPTFTTWQLEGKGQDYQLSALANCQHSFQPSGTSVSDKRLLLPMLGYSWA